MFMLPFMVNKDVYTIGMKDLRSRHTPRRADSQFTVAQQTTRHRKRCYYDGA